MISVASRLPDIEPLPGETPPRAARPAPVAAWRAPPLPEIERLADPGGPLRRPARAGRPAPGPRRTAWPQPARRPPAPAPRAVAPAAARPPPPSPRAGPRPVPAAAAPAADLEIPAFLSRPPAAPTAPARPAAGARAVRVRLRWGRIGAAAAAAVGVAAALIGLGGADDLGGGRAGSAPSAAPALTPAAAAEIPPDYLALYRRFGREMDLDWRFLAAIGAQESDHGRNPWADGVNAAGCVGPMQLGVGGRCGDFVGAWGADGDGDGRVDPRRPADAIATAARGLRLGKGAPPRGGDAAGYRSAACGYYGACSDARADYADEVMARAVRYGFPG